MPTTPLIPENAPFTAAQRTWLNGFLAGLFAQNAAESTTASSEATERPLRPLLILFGSQTGTAEGLAQRISAHAAEAGFAPRVMEANAATTVEWASHKRLIVVTSTYGEGDMPDNAQGFWDWLKTDAAMALAHLDYAVLALGDSSYEHFCAAGKKIDERLAELGAKRANPRSDCDVDYAATAKEWTQAALAALGTPGDSDATASQQALPEQPSTATSSKPQTFSRKNPFPAILLTNRRLTGEGSGKEVRHFEFSLEGSGMTYEAGDALGVQPANCPSLVDELLAALHFDGEEAVPRAGGGDISLRKALGDCCEITRPSQELLSRVAERNAELRGLMTPDKKADLKQWLWGREVIDLLLATPGLTFSAAEFAGLLRPLAPRLYSIASSPKVHSGQVHLTVGIVRHSSHGRERKGVCSTFLADRASGRASVPAFVQSSHGFRLPASGDTPIIMVGPGTGVAPFRAFLHERLAIGANGGNWLFFGEQKAASDFYYREELESMMRSGHLTKLCTAFSRDQANKIYVQDRMMEAAAELGRWLEAGAHFYVCGDAMRMAKDVDAALHRVIETALGKKPEQASEYVSRMKSEKRYQRDVY
jgi:sulfite reductase (NADPH) flavoprotein alpha-component